MSIEVTTLDLAALQVLRAQLKGQLSKFGYSPEFLNAVAVAEEWLEFRQREFFRLKENANDAIDEHKARKLLRWGKDEEVAICHICEYLHAKGNPYWALRLRDGSKPK